jgi:diphthamide biosynthesis protein 7
MQNPYLPWLTRPSSSSAGIMTSLSNGYLAHLTPRPSGYEVAQEWKAHDYEPWVTAFDQWDPNTVWSGGSACCLSVCLVWCSRSGADSVVAAVTETGNLLMAIRRR